MKHLLLAALLFAVPTSASFANDWFPFDRHEALRRIRAAIEKMERIAPIPELECRPNPSIIRYCAANLTSHLTLEIDETFRDKRDYEAFRNGSLGLVYEITAVLKLDGARSRDTEMFDTLCTASVMALRPSMSAEDAFRRYSTALRQSINKSKTDDSDTLVVGNPDTLITKASPFDLSCAVSAEDDYWQK